MTAYPARRRGQPRAPVSASLLPALLLCGCAAGPYQDELMVESTNDLNKTFADASSLVNIRVFQLIDKEPFLDKSLTIPKLFSDDSALPSGTWVQPIKTLRIEVEDKASIPIEIKPETRFLGIVAIFNENDGVSRVVLPIEEIGDKKLFFHQYSVSVEDPEFSLAKSTADDANGGQE